MSDTAPLWSGRFTASVAPRMFELTSSIDVDIALLPYDIAATRAHARVLHKAGLLDAEELERIDAAALGIIDRFSAGDLQTSGFEDVHSLVEAALTEELGDVGRKIHAGRSRNDLVAADLRLWCKDNAVGLALATCDLVETTATTAAGYVDAVMPGYTHVQRAQPVSLAFHLLAHGFALERDARRFLGAARAADVNPLGAGALAGTSLPVDAAVATDELGFAATFDNAMDAVSDRDFACDLAYAAAMCSVHLSRLAEDIVLWTSSEFGFARLSDEWSTGSSMMPQKRNPDMAELIRGRAARGIGDLVGLLTLLKGLPLAYDRDLQEDKEVVFSTVARTRACLQGMRGLLGGLEFDREAMAAAARGGAMWATDLAEKLVARGVPFRTAHETTGRLVVELEAQELTLDHAAEALTAHHDLYEKEDVGASDPAAGLAARSSHGGPAPVRVAEQLATLESRIADLRDEVLEGR